MLIGKNLILATKPFAKEIRIKSWFHTISTLSLLILALCGALFFPILSLKLAASIVAGLLLIRKFIAYDAHQLPGKDHMIITTTIIQNCLVPV